MQRNSCFVTVCVCATFMVCVAMVSNAGPLDPPGSPAPTMKTLDEVEARIPINDVFTPGSATSRYVISQSGSYYLTDAILVSDIDNAIEVRAPNVTIDLNGYTIAGSTLFGSPSNGVVLANTAINAALTVRNGTITGFVSAGLRANRSDQYVTLRDMAFIENSSGVSVLGSVDAASCSFLRNTGNGLFASRGSIVRDCRSLDNGFFGISISSGLVEGCIASRNGADGISIGFDDDSASIARGNVVNSNDNFGISALDAIVEGNAVQSNAGGGIRTQTLTSFSILAAGVIEHNYLKLNGDAAGEMGIYVTGEHYRVESNTITGSPVGVMVSGVSNNVITRNTVNDATTAYDIPVGNVIPLLGAEYSTDRAWQNIEQ